jgi:hypothetical protein
MRFSAFFPAPCFLAATLSAQDFAAPAGAFASGIAGARSAGLAEAQTAAPTGAEAAAINPAALSEVKDWAVAYSHANRLGLLPEHQTAAVARPPGRPFVLGLSWNRLGDVGYAENQLLLSGAYNRGFVALGGNYKFRFVDTEGGTGFRDPESGLQRRVTGLAIGWLGFDAGATVAPFGPRYRLGLMVKDLFSRISWESKNAAGTAEGRYAEYLPVSMRYGFFFDPDPFLDFSVDFEPALYHDGHSWLASGAEMIPFALLSEGPAKRILQNSLALRLGYSRILFEEEAMEKFALGAGFGVEYRDMTLSVDMAYEMHFGFGGENPLRIGIRLGR